MKKTCEHLEIDGWHVPTQEARELVRRVDRDDYGWGDQWRAEMSGDLSRWMWPGLIGLLLVGIAVRDWLLITASVSALTFFMYQAFTLVRTLRASKLVTATTREIFLADSDGKDELWCTHVQIDKQRQDVSVICPRCIALLKSGERLDVMIATDPDDASNNWLVGFRQRS